MFLLAALWIAGSESTERSSSGALVGRWELGPPPAQTPIGKSDEDWLSLSFAGYQGPEFRLEVDPIEQRFEATRGVASGPSILSVAEAHLRSAIETTRLFDLRAGADPDVTSAALTSPADYRLQVSIDGWTHGDVRLDTESGHVGIEMSFRVLDVRTRQVLFSTSEDAKISLSVSSSAGTIDHDRSSRLAVKACLNKGLWRVANWFKDRPWTGEVTRIRSGQVDFDAGSGRGLEVGMTLRALADGRQIWDSETGLAVGSVTGEIGRLKIVALQEDLASATVVAGCDGIRPGDRVELLR